MKQIIFLMLLSFGTFGQTVHRVTNGMNLQTVIDNAASGDVILVEGGVYGNIGIQKKISIYGAGFYSKLNNTAGDGITKLGNILFYGNGSGSILKGFECGDINIYGNHILVSNTKCRTVNIGQAQAISGSERKTTGVFFSKNFCYQVNIYGESANFKISNNIFLGTYSSGGITLGTTGYGIVEYNSFLTSTYQIGYYPWFIDYRNTVFKNNIFSTIRDNQGSRTNLILYVVPNVLENNVFQNSFNALPISNKVNINPSDVFLAYSENPDNLQEDARYQLAHNSPARGAGENGTDCGAFGGDDPYVLSGIPDIPSIYQLTVPSQVPQNGTLNVQIKAKTNN